MKPILRKELSKKRNALKPESVRLLSKLVEDNLFEAFFFKNAEKIGLYFSKENEVLTERIILDLLEDGKRVFLPRIKKKELEFKEIKKLDALEKGSFGIMEPKENCLTINPDELDLVIVPCVAVDEQGNRIGRGAGFYDRFLTKNKGIKTICLAYDFQVLPKIRTEVYDKRVDFIITEKRIIKTKNEDREYKLLDGRKIADELLSELKKKIKEEGIKAKLAVILVGNHPSSEVYVKNKEKKCREVGIDFQLIRFKKNISEEQLKTKIKELNENKEVHGILIQLPLPEHIDTDRIINTILPKKDVDGLTKINMKNLANGNEVLACPTPKGIIKLLEKNKIKLEDKNIVLVGSGRLVGYPLSLMLKNRNLNFKVCDINTKDLKAETLKADVLISATGVPHLIKKDYVKKGCVVVDAGISKLRNKLVGDVDFEKVKEKCSWITPVPKGVGPMTIAMLIENVIHSYELLTK